MYRQSFIMAFRKTEGLPTEIERRPAESRAGRENCRERGKRETAEKGKAKLTFSGSFDINSPEEARAFGDYLVFFAQGRYPGQLFGCAHLDLRRDLRRALQGPKASTRIPAGCSQLQRAANQMTEEDCSEMFIVPIVLLICLIALVLVASIDPQGGAASFFPGLKGVAESVRTPDRRKRLWADFAKTWPFFLVLILFFVMAYAHNNNLLGKGYADSYTYLTAALVSLCIAGVIYGSLFFSGPVKILEIVLLLLLMIPCDMITERKDGYTYLWLYLWFYLFLAGLFFVLTSLKALMEREDLKPTVLTLTAVCLWYFVSSIFFAFPVFDARFRTWCTGGTILAVLLLFLLRKKPFFPERTQPRE